MESDRWVLSLDVGADAGYALLNTRSGKLQSGTLRYKKKKHHRYGHRFIQFSESLDSFREQFPLDYVCYEQPRGDFKNYAARLSVMGYIATLLTWCAANELDHHGYPQTEIKKFATANGNARKPEMLAAAQQRWPEQGVVSDDQADALWVLELDRQTTTTKS